MVKPFSDHIIYLFLSKMAYQELRHIETQMVSMTQTEQIFQIFQQMSKNNKPIEIVSTDLKMAEKLKYTTQLGVE